MKTNSDALLLSPSYQGTSFAEISDGLVKVIADKRLPINVVGRQNHFANTLPADRLDDSRFIEAHHSNLRTLFQGRYKRVLAMDFYGLGLDMVKYQAVQEGRDVEFGALFHGASFMDRDVYTKGWISEFERAWGKLYSKIYTPSPNSVAHFPDDLKPKVRVFPWGMDAFNPLPENDGDKPIEVLFPHRLSADKGIEDLIEIATLVPDVVIHITVPQTQEELERNEYYAALRALPNIQFIIGENDEQHNYTLARAKIVLSTAYQELFGYSVMKAVVSGAIPVLPDRQCYPHYFSRTHIYAGNGEAAEKIKTLLSKMEVRQSIEEVTAQTRSVISGFSFEGILQDFFGAV